MAFHSYRLLVDFFFGMQLIVSMLVRHYSFAFPNGPTTKVVNHRAYALRARVDGEEGPRVPLTVNNLRKL